MAIKLVKLTNLYKYFVKCDTKEDDPRFPAICFNLKKENLMIKKRA